MNLFSKDKGKDPNKLVIELREEIIKKEAKISHLRQENQLGDNLNKNLEKRIKQLTDNLTEIKEFAEKLAKEVEKMSSPPLSYATLVEAYGELALVDVNGSLYEVNISDNIDKKNLIPGITVTVNPAFNIVAIKDHEPGNLVATIESILDGDRILAINKFDEKHVLRLKGSLNGKVKIGDLVRYHFRSGFVYEVLPKTGLDEFLLEEVPDVMFEKIGGLEEEIIKIKDTIELPYLHTEEFKEMELNPRKGILLYGPPGCGKTMIAKAIANSLAKKVEEKTGKPSKGYFINTSATEFATKWYGETEGKIRNVFKKAAEKAKDDMPVIIFIDEFESIFRTRNTGISDDASDKAVSQLLASLDGVKDYKNIFVIAATNRQELIDPAILRDGRLDVKIQIKRPNEDSAKKIFFKYITESVPLHESELKTKNKREAIESIVNKTVAEIFSTKPENAYVQFYYNTGDVEKIYFKDLISGAMIEGIVSRAKLYAIKEKLETGEKGIKYEHFVKAVTEEYKENRDLPNTRDPNEWAKILGRRLDNIKDVRVLVKKDEAQKPVEVISDDRGII